MREGLASTGEFLGRKALASAVKSVIVKRGAKKVINKYMYFDQALDTFTSDLSKKTSPTGGANDIHKMIGKLPCPKKGYVPGSYKYMGK